MPHILINDSIISKFVPRAIRLHSKFFAVILITLLLGVIGVWFSTATSVVDLGAGNNMIKSGLEAQWRQGSVVVLVRHAERCDRSANPCLGDIEGITIEGSNAAMVVGKGLRRLGLEKARMVASPLPRARQTADFISGRVVATQEWVSECDDGFKGAVIAHKSDNENLVLITHSGCIDHFERLMGVRAGARSSAYTQAIFVQVDGRHKPNIIGSLEATEWGKIR
ncbi:histidine phosphatase family protein [Pseudomonas mandelii]|uniref:Phosphohistidine phosphatase SixA n=1 Tax=Pseudomonas mandelii TaxID=75612 RepID=A0ABY0VIF6_9PSED|nr:histidine phosphatase family protein [Pseudomonas mandelii]TWS08173.1 histidine phosphatase family protein [Pseudomonas mandelii]SDU28781.1 Phosphohistidine phosphatase SixA [Pseudomonas mandelii]